MIGPFWRKGIFLWCYWDVHNGDATRIAQSLVEAGFEAVYVHCNDGATEASYPRWEGDRYVSHVNCTDELVADLRAAGLAVVGWGAPYGANTAGEIAMMVSQTRRYQLEGYVIDAEGKWDAQGDVISDTRRIITEYKAAFPELPVAWCWWPIYHVPGKTGVYHQRAILEEAMKWADCAMPMAYWNWKNDPLGTGFLEETIRQWREVTSKPIIPAGRAYNDEHGTASYEAVLAFSNRARELGCQGITWWDMQHAIRLPETWSALAKSNQIDSGTEVPVADYSTHAIGLYTKTATWTNQAFHFIIGHAGEGYGEPNPQLKPIEERALGFGRTFGALWDFNARYYSENQYMGDDAHWPPLAQDWPYQMFVRALTSRDVKFVVVRVLTETAANGKAEDPRYLAYAARRFLNRVRDWLAANKPGVKLVLATSHEWISKNAPDMLNWAFEYPSMVVQPAITPLVDSYPQAADRVKFYISTRPTCEFWWYYDTSSIDLVLFYLGAGTPEQFAAWLGIDAPEDPGAENPGTGEEEKDPLETRVDVLEAAILAQAKEIAALQQWRAAILEASK